MGEDMPAVVRLVALEVLVVVVVLTQQVALVVLEPRPPFKATTVEPLQIPMAVEVVVAQVPQARQQMLVEAVAQARLVVSVVAQ